MGSNPHFISPRKYPLLFKYYIEIKCIHCLNTVTVNQDLTYKSIIWPRKY